MPDEVMAAGRRAGRAVAASGQLLCRRTRRHGRGDVDGVLVDRHLAIFNVATSAQQRRHGYGAAVTAIAIRDGFAAGAHTAWLQSSPMGLGVYERLGFVLVEPWRCWMRTPVDRPAA